MLLRFQVLSVKGLQGFGFLGFGFFGFRVCRV